MATNSNVGQSTSAGCAPVAIAFALVALSLSCSNRGTVLVGGACSGDEACVTGVCIRQSSSKSNTAWAGGYCSGNCDTYTGSGSTCPQGQCLLLADGHSYCVAQCAGDQDCRAGYVCSANTCLPNCNRWDCGSSLVCDAATGKCTSAAGNLPIGAPCALNLECATGLCIPQRNDNERVAWSGGTCSQECDGSCPGGATCITLEDGSAYCVPSCAGPADCRPGYVCSTAVAACLPDCRLGWSCGTSLVCDLGSGECTPATPVAGTTPLGEACTLNTDCATELCIPERTGTATVAWTGGACSQQCSSIVCPSGAVCVPMEDGSAWCVPPCTGLSDCRTGYVCDVELFGCLPDCRLGWSCGTRLVCDLGSGSCVLPSTADAGVSGDAGWRGGDDAGAGSRSDSGGFGQGGDDAGRGNGPGPGGGGMWADRLPPSL